MKSPRSNPAAKRRSLSSLPWTMCLLLAGILLVAASYLGGRHAMHWWRSRKVAECLKAANAQLKNEEWGLAARWIREAAEMAPDDPGVVRATAEFQILTHSHPSDVIQTLQRLSSTWNADADDLTKLARAQIDLGSHDAARKTLALLPETVRSTNAEAAEAEAILLKMERRGSEADARLRVALAHGGGDAQTSLKMAVLDLKQPHPETRQRGRDGLWSIAREHGANAAGAIRVLAEDPALSANDASRLLEVVEKGGQASREGLRYLVLAKLVNLRPEARDDILNRETESAANSDETHKLAFARWLSSLNEHKRLLAFLPASMKWKDMSADMAQLKLEALANTGQWVELIKVLDHDVEKVLGAASFNLWQARAVAAQGGGAARVEQHLNLAFGATGRGQDSRTAVQVAQAAEKLGALDLAAAFYRSIAALASSPQHRLLLLEKTYALHLSAQDTHGMLQMAAEIAELTPGNQTNAFRANYLALLAGEWMEVVAFRIAAMQKTTDSEFSSRLLLLRAMAAHRLHAPLQEPGALKDLRHLPWEPGQRAVLAAMLATHGDAATGFQIAEKIPDKLLLPEEKRFLSLAR